MFFKQANSVEKQQLNFRNASVSLCFRNLSLTIIWDNLGLSDYKGMKEILNLEKNTCYNSNRNYSVPYAKESPSVPQMHKSALMHLWHLSTIPSFWEEYFAERL